MIGPGEYETSDIDGARRLLDQHFSVHQGTVCRASEVLPALVVLEFLADAVKTVGVDILSVLIYDAVKGWITRPKEAKSIHLDITLRDAGGGVRSCVVEASDEETLRRGIDLLFPFSEHAPSDCIAAFRAGTKEWEVLSVPPAPPDTASQSSGPSPAPDVSARPIRQPMPSIKCLSVRQPWAELILLGRKRYELRTWRTKHRGPLAIHAAATLGRQDRENCLLAGLDYAVLPCGAIVGTVEVSRCVSCDISLYEEFVANHAAFAPWKPGIWAWELAQPVRLPEPVPFKGRPGLFTIDALGG